jgi:septal ring factor EnvC (AmiA/AmiB activator)
MRDLNEIAADMAEQSNIVHERIRAGMAENEQLKDHVADLEARLTAMEAEANTLRAERDRVLDAAERVNCVWSNPEMRADRKDREKRLALGYLPPPSGLVPAIDALAKMLADEYERPTGSALAPEDR